MGLGTGYTLVSAAIFAGTLYFWDEDDGRQPPAAFVATLISLAWPMLAPGALLYKGGRLITDAGKRRRARLRALAWERFDQAVEVEIEMNRQGFYGDRAQRLQLEQDKWAFDSYTPLERLYKHDAITLPPEPERRR